MERLNVQALPKGRWTAYARARLFEALAEAAVAAKFLREGFLRNAAGKAFQAWKSLMAAYAALERERLLAVAEGEERALLRKRALLSMPTGGLKSVAQLLEAAGYAEMSHITALALDLHQYQYNGLDPGGDLSPYGSPRAVTRDVQKVVESVREYALRLKDRAWSEDAEKAMEELERYLKS